LKILYELLTVFIITQICIVGIAYSTDFHVSLSGNDITGNGSINTPWRTPEYGAKQLSGGDTLYIHAGTYNISTDNVPGDYSVKRYLPMVSPSPTAVGTLANQIIITNYEKDSVTLDGGINPTWPVAGAGSDNQPSSNRPHFTTIRGMTIIGAVEFWHVNYGTIENNDISAPYPECSSGNTNICDNFGCAVRVESVTDQTIRNNKIHSNSIGITQLNSPLIMEYDATNLVIEYNDIYNSVGIGIRLKDNPENIIIRYNYIHSNALAGIQSANQDTGHDIYIYQNVFRNNNTTSSTEYSGDITQLVEVHNWYIYNNTFYGNNYANILTSRDRSTISGINSWNNIFFSDMNAFYRLDYGATFASQWSYSDYNNFYGTANWVESSTWSTLSTYQSENSEEFDVNSINSNPNFLNPHGITAASFKRASYPTNGRGGSYVSVMGAYITGDETIGYSNSDPSPSLPSPPINFKIE
jgi:Right handed beta helix region